MKKTNILGYLVISLLAVIGILMPAVTAYSAGCGTYGGVSLSTTATMLGVLNDIDGAFYDSATGQVIFVKKGSNISAPDMNSDDLAVALRSIYGIDGTAHDPALSLDIDKTNKNQLNVRYEGQTRQTNFGQLMYNADYRLKKLMLGLVDSSALSGIGYKSLTTRFQEAHILPNGNIRMWFVPKEVQLINTPDSSAMMFNTVSMELQSESKFFNNVSFYDPIADQFIDNFNAITNGVSNFDRYAAVYTELKELLRLGKITAVVKWIKDNNIPIDLSYLEGYEPAFVNTPDTADALSAPLFGPYNLSGGIVYDFNSTNFKSASSSKANNTQTDAINSRPSDPNSSWEFTTTDGITYTAVAKTLSRTKKDGEIRRYEVDMAIPVSGDNQLVLERYYNSFNEKISVLGTGWEIAPYKLRFPGAKQNYIVVKDNSKLSAYYQIYVTAKGNESLYTLGGLNGSNRPVYTVDGGNDRLVENSDGSFTIYKETEGKVDLNSSGKLTKITDKNGIYITYSYDTSSRLSKIKHQGGSSITLSYIDSKLDNAQENGTNGRRMTYEYLGSNLSGVKNQLLNKISYEYDTYNRLNKVTDPKGKVVFSATYDEYNRANDKTYGMNSRSLAYFDLINGTSVTNTTVNSTNDLKIEKTFDDSSRVTYQKVSGADIPTAVTTIAYDDYFGPKIVNTPTGGVLLYSHDANGHVKSAIINAPVAADTIERRYLYDNAGFLSISRDGNGRDRAFAYDANHRVTASYNDCIAEVDSAGEFNGNATCYLDSLTSYIYNTTSGRVKTVIDPDSRAIGYSHDANGLPKSVTKGFADASGNITSGLSMTMDYDYRSRLSTVKMGSDDRATTYTYYNDDRVKTITTPAGLVQFGYDANGNRNSITDGNNNVTEYTHDDNNQLVKVTIKDKTVSVAEAKYEYSNTDKTLLTDITLPNQTQKTISYNALKRPVSIITNSTSGIGAKGVIPTNIIDFKTIVVGTNPIKSAKVCNIGDAALGITSVAIANTAIFSTVSPVPSSVAPGVCADVQVQFVKNTPGDWSSTLTIAVAGGLSKQISLKANNQSLGLTATPGTTNIALKWSMYNSPSLNHYSIYRQEAVDGQATPSNVSPDQLIGTTSTVSYTDNGLNLAKSYYYAVVAYGSNSVALSTIEWIGPVYINTHHAMNPLGLEETLSDGAGNNNAKSVKLVYNSSRNNYFAVYAYDKDGNGNNWDIYGQRLSARAEKIGAAIPIMTNSISETNPRVAYNSNNDEYMVIATITNGTGQMMKTQRVSAADGSLIGNYKMLYAPCLSGKAILNSPSIEYSVLDNNYFVAMESICSHANVSAIAYATLSVDGTTYSNKLTLDTAGIQRKSPSVAFNTAGEKFIAYTENGTKVYGTLINRSNGSAKWSTQIYSDQTTQSTGVNAAYSLLYNNFTIIWEVDNGNLRYKQIASDGTVYPSGGYKQVVGGGSNVFAPNVVNNTNADVNIFGFTSQVISSGEYSLYFIEIAASDLSLVDSSNVRVISAISNVKENRVSIAYNNDSNQYLAAYESENGNSTSVKIRRIGDFYIPETKLDFGAGVVGLETTLHPIVYVSDKTIGISAISNSPWIENYNTSFSSIGYEGRTYDIYYDFLHFKTGKITATRDGLAPGLYDGKLTYELYGASEPVDIHMEVTDTPPTPPTNPMPSSGATALTIDPATGIMLNWTPSTDPDVGEVLTYYVNISNMPSMVNSITDTSSKAAYNAMTLGYGKTYYWQVAVHDNYGEIVNGPVWSFSTAAMPAPTLIPYTDPAKNPKPTLQWYSVPGSAGYFVRIASDSAFTNSIDSYINTTSYTPSQTLAEGKVYWRVASITDANVKVYSDISSFTLDFTAPAKPTLVDYTPALTSNRRPSFTWSMVSDANNYQIQISSQGDFAKVAVDKLINTTSYIVTSDLAEGKVYWRVRSLDQAGNASDYAVGNIFKIDATAPHQIEGLTATQDGSAIRLNWQPIGMIDDFKQFNVYRDTTSFSDVSALTPIAQLTSSSAVTYRDSQNVVAGVTYYYGVIAVDKTGNENKSVVGAASITLDLTKPASMIKNLVDGSVIIGTSYLINGTASSSSSTVQKVEISLDNGQSWLQTSGTTSWSYNWNFSNETVYKISVRATDALGNVENPSRTISVKTYTRTPSHVSINNKQLFVDGNRLTVKGTVYSPTPIGHNPEVDPPYGDYFTSEYAKKYVRDLELLKAMGSNTVRLYDWDINADHTDFLDKAFNIVNSVAGNPIYVIPGFWINAGLDISPVTGADVREQLKSDFRRMVATHKNHPAILMWAIGTDLNSSDKYGNDPNLFSLLSEMADVAHQEEGVNNFHPVTTALEDNALLINGIAANVNSSLDVWGVNSYRGDTFGTLFADYGVISNQTKPMVILEYGIDAYNEAISDEYESQGDLTQSIYAAKLWNEIIQHSDVCIGGTMMEYSDEWWRGAKSLDTDCNDTDSNYQGVCGHASNAQPDGYSNDEWLGIMRTTADDSDLTGWFDAVEPRELYSSMQRMWTTDVTSPKVGVAPTPVNFGVLGIGIKSAVKTITVQNTGTDNVTYGTVGITGVNSAEFTKESDTCSGANKIFAPNKTCDIKVSFTPSGVGYRQSTLSVSPTNSASVSTIINGTGASTLHVGIAPTNEAGTVTSDAGSVISCPGVCDSTVTGAVTLSANNNAGYSFNNWSGDVSGVNSSLTISADALTSRSLTSITANFNRYYSITTLPGAHGNIQCTPGNPVASGVNVTCSVIADSGYTIDASSVMVDNSSAILTNNAYTFPPIDADHTISANFILWGPVRINGTTPSYYSTLQSAYDNASSGSVISAQAQTFSETLNANRNISVTINGGYDSNYIQIIGSSTVNGIAITNSAGTVTIGGFDLKN